MRIFVISLINATERRAEVARQLARFSLDFEFFDAVERVSDAFQHFDGLDQRLYRLNTGCAPLPGEIGCYASHKALWQTCVDLNRPIVILEDDFCLADNFAEALTGLEALINTFGFIRLQSNKRPRKKVFPFNHIRHAYRVPDGQDCRLHYLAHVPLCLLAYGISPAAAATLIKGSNILSAPVDKYVQQTWTHSTPVFSLAEPVVSMSDLADDSTIGTRQQRGRNIGYLLRRLLFKVFGQYQRGQFNRTQLVRLGIKRM